MRILGIDPGTAIVGYSIVDFEKDNFIVLDYGCIYTHKDEDMPVRLEKIYNELKKLIIKWKPNDMAIENLFFFKNQKTVIEVGQARGVITLVGQQNGLHTFASKNGNCRIWSCHKTTNSRNGKTYSKNG